MPRQHGSLGSTSGRAGGRAAPGLTVVSAVHHLPRAEGEAERDHGGEALGDRGNAERDGDLQVVDQAVPEAAVHLNRKCGQGYVRGSNGSRGLRPWWGRLPGSCQKPPRTGSANF